MSLFFDSRGQAVATYHHHRVEMMGFRTVRFALGGCKLNQGHGSIIGDPQTNEKQQQKQQSYPRLVE